MSCVHTLSASAFIFGPSDYNFTDDKNVHRVTESWSFLKYIIQFQISDEHYFFLNLSEHVYVSLNHLYKVLVIFC